MPRESTKTPGESILCSQSSEQNLSGVWYTGVFAQSHTHVHAFAHMLCAYTETHFVLSCFEEFATQKLKEHRKILEASSLPVPISWDVVRKCR